MKCSLFKLSLISLFLPFSLLGMEPQKAASSTRFVPNNWEQHRVVYSKSDFADLQNTFHRIATLHKTLLDQFNEINETISQLGLENVNNSSLKHTLKAHNYSINRSEISAKMMLIDSMIEKIFAKETDLLELLDKTTEDSGGALVKYLLAQAELVSSLEEFPVNESELWQHSVKDLNRKTNEVSKKAAEFLKKCQKHNSAQNFLGIAQRYAFDANEQLLFAENKIDPDFFGQAIKADCPNIKGIVTIKDPRNNMTLYLHQSKKASAKNEWYESCTKEITNWFVAPEINLVNKGYRDVNDRMFNLANYAIAFHSFPKAVNEFAQKYGTYRISERETEVFIPAHIFKNGHIIYGTCEFIWDNKTKQCYHRFFKPIDALKTAGTKINDNSNNSSDLAVNEDNDNVATLVAIFQRLRAMGKSKVLESRVDNVRRSYDKQVKKEQKLHERGKKASKA